MARKPRASTAPTSDQSSNRSADADLVEFTYYYRRDSAHATNKRETGEATRSAPTTAIAAATSLWQRNRLFAGFIADCADGPAGRKGAARQVRIRLEPREVGLVKKATGFPDQEPFAAILGCVDARAPVELLFAQGFDDLYITRVAGNTLGPDCAGSLHYALHSFAALKGTAPEDLPKKTLRLVVALGHADCGAVTAAVKTFLEPESLPGLEGKYLPDGSIGGLLAKIHHPSVAVAVEALPENALGTSAHAAQIRMAALIDLSVYLNAAWSARQMQALVQQYDWLSPDLAVEVRYGVFDPRDCHVRAGAEHYLFVDGKPAQSPARVEDALAPPPADLRELRQLADRLAAKIKKHGSTKSGMEGLAHHYRARPG